ncbi:VOC family protein [Plantactinospora sp. WMMB782]|uniref:VOC family protein n=1 Tax=Plantactinospora sp. WMMB782 TaxID=3404121 RepID=UPI003B954EC7
MIRWLTASLDAPTPAADGFWPDVTGWTPSPSRVTLLPPYGDAFLRMRVVADGPARAHLDLHVEDVAAEAGHMVRRGATVVRESDGTVVLRSPAGLPFCLVRWRGESVWPEAEGRRHRMCLDVPSALFDVEGRFWSRAIARERPTPLNLLLQRREGRPAGMHLHLERADRDAETQRHVGAGASVVRVAADRTTLRDPAGRDYCLTDLPPRTAEG